MGSATTYANNVALPAFAHRTLLLCAMQWSIGLTDHSSKLIHAGTDRQTDGRLTDA